MEPDLGDVLSRKFDEVVELRRWKSQLISLNCAVTGKIRKQELAELFQGLLRLAEIWGVEYWYHRQ